MVIRFRTNLEGNHLVFVQYKLGLDPHWPEALSPTFHLPRASTYFAVIYRHYSCGEYDSTSAQGSASWYSDVSCQLFLRPYFPPFSVSFLLSPLSVVVSDCLHLSPFIAVFLYLCCSYILQSCSCS